MLRLAPGKKLPAGRDAALRPSFRRLAGYGGTRKELSTLASGSAGAAGARRWQAGLHLLERAGAICYEVHDVEGMQARMVPMVSNYRFVKPGKTAGRRVLSRFACLRREQERILLESPLAPARVELAPRAVALLAPLFVPDHPERASVPEALADLLDAAGLLTEAAGTGRTREDLDPVLRPWEFADLLFHARSRLGRHDAPVGATFEYDGVLPSLPATKPRGHTRAVSLPRPDLARLALSDPPFSRILESRRSVRKLSRTPVDVTQLGEFLFRVGRVREQYPKTDTLPYETTSRPYPSGGACYPLEIYLAVSRCAGLARGVYHYEPVGHRLERVPGGRAQVSALLEDTRQIFGPTPPVLVMLTARFGRLNWKYRSIAYSTILKDVGVLLQTMYLVATAMDLAPCAVGCGDADRSARLLGTRFESESSVGEFLLGVPPEGVADVPR